MKRFLSALFVMMLMGAADVFAQVFPDGYYRISNQVTGRHASLVDKKGSMTVSGSSYKYDFGAIALKDNFDAVVDDPGAIIRFEYRYLGKSALNGYYLEAQGDGNYVLVMHGFYMRTLGAMFRKRGYRVRNRRIFTVPNLCTVEAVKDREA